MSTVILIYSVFIYLFEAVSSPDLSVKGSKCTHKILFKDQHFLPWNTVDHDGYQNIKNFLILNQLLILLGFY